MSQLDLLVAAVAAGVLAIIYGLYRIAVTLGEEVSRQISGPEESDPNCALCHGKKTLLVYSADPRKAPKHEECPLCYPRQGDFHE